MSTGKVFITEERIKRLETAIESLLYQTDKDQYSLVHVKRLAPVVGQIISLQNVVGKKVKKVRLMSRQMYRCILLMASWNAPVIVTDEAMSELLFRKTNARSLNGLGKSLETETFYEVCLYADASSNGYIWYLEMYESTLEAGRSKVSHKKISDPQERVIVGLRKWEVYPKKWTEKYPRKWVEACPRKWTELDPWKWRGVS